jgi:hypothetical protein
VPATVEPVEPIPLIPRRRLIGSMFGNHTALRRGEGSDIAGSRPYQPGDHYHSIDWKSSARLSSLRGRDEFIVRERFADETPHIVLVCDRRPEMALYPPPLPWLDKPAAVRNVVELLVVSIVNNRGLVGYLDYAGHDGENEPGLPFWRPPRAQASFWHGELVELTRSYLDGGWDAPPDNMTTALSLLSILGGSVPPGSFVFVVSDFIVPPSQEALAAVVGSGWDVVAVIVQDPVWEQSFPPLGGMLAPILDVRGGTMLHVRLTEREADERREANESRLREIRAGLARLGLDSILVSKDDPASIRHAFVDWAEQRLALKGLR